MQYIFLQFIYLQFMIYLEVLLVPFQIFSKENMNQAEYILHYITYNFKFEYHDSIMWICCIKNKLSFEDWTPDDIPGVW